MIRGHGMLWAHLFENAAAGLPRDIYWGLHIAELTSDDAAPVAIEAINCEWLKLPVRRVRQLSSYAHDVGLHASPIECSVYRDAEHHLVGLDKLSLEVGTAADRFVAHITLRPLDQSGIIPSSIEVECQVRFEGIIIVPENLKPSPGTPDAAASMVAPYVDIDELEPPVWDRFRYLLKPKAPAGTAS